MTFTDAAVVLLALLAVIHVLLLISLRRRVTRTEGETSVLRADVREIRMDTNTLWVSANHQLPPHIKRLDIR